MVAGSTLRVGGDMVPGDRLVRAVGYRLLETPPTARKRAEAGDVILLTEGSGGGTITTTAPTTASSMLYGRPLMLTHMGI